jgi:hypothetical protein
LPAIEIRPRRATELVDAAFQLMRRYYPALFTVAAIAMSPSVIVRVVMRGALSDPTVMVSNPAPFFLGAFVASICSIIADAVLIVAVADGYLEGNVDLGGALKSGARGLLGVLGAGLVRGLFLGFVFLMLGIALALLTAMHLQILMFVLVPLGAWAAIFVVLRTFAMNQAVLLEHTSPLQALTRSMRLSEKCTAHIFFTLGLVWLLYFVTYGVALGIAAQIASRSVAEIIGGVVIVAIYPLLATVATLLYYDLRVRKEGFDLEVMSRELGTSSTAPGGSPLPAA